MRALLLLVLSVSSLLAGFGTPPRGWNDIKFGLVSNGIAYSADNALSFDTHRLKVATEELGIKIDYRYRYVNEGVNPYGNACVNLFNWKWDADYSKHAQRDGGVEASYVIYVLQEEGGRIKLLENMKSAEKMRQFFHTLIIVAEHAKGYGATIVVEPDTWGYLLQDHYQNKPIESIETDPLKIPAMVNNLEDIHKHDYFWTIPDTSKPWNKVADSVERVISLDYMSDLPNTMAGFGRAMIRTLHKFAPDSYVGFLASHWSVNLGLDGNGWSQHGLVWADSVLIDTSAKINIDFFNKFYYGSITEENPVQPGDLPDFIGVEKNGWCAGLYETKKTDPATGGPVMSWYWDDTHMKNYLKWVKQIGEGLDLPVLGWQISIGNMDNVNLEDYPNMANSFKDTFFPYFFKHVDEFLDAGFIGFLVGKGLSQGTDYTLPGERVGENGWFLSKLKEFDVNRPYLDTTGWGQESVVTAQKNIAKGSLVVTQTGRSLRYELPQSLHGQEATVQLLSVSGRVVAQQSVANGAAITLPLDGISHGFYVATVQSGREFLRRGVLVQ